MTPPHPNEDIDFIIPEAQRPLPEGWQQPSRDDVYFAHPKGFSGWGDDPAAYITAAAIRDLAVSDTLRPPPPGHVFPGMMWRAFRAGSRDCTGIDRLVWFAHADRSGLCVLRNRPLVCVHPSAVVSEALAAVDLGPHAPRAVLTRAFEIALAYRAAAGLPAPDDSQFADCIRNTAHSICTPVSFHWLLSIAYFTVELRRPYLPSEWVPTRATASDAERTP